MVEVHSDLKVIDLPLNNVHPLVHFRVSAKVDVPEEVLREDAHRESEVKRPGVRDLSPPAIHTARRLCLSGRSSRGQKR